MTLREMNASSTGWPNTRLRTRPTAKSPTPRFVAVRTMAASWCSAVEVAASRNKHAK